MTAPLSKRPASGSLEEAARRGNDDVGRDLRSAASPRSVDRAISSDAVDLTEALAAAPYPGRGLAVVRCGNGALGLVCWLTGRSEASRERLLRASGPDLFVQDRRGGQASDPLRHYRASRQVHGYDVVGNGDHVDHLAAAIEQRAGAIAAWCAEQPEPDAPLHTARLLAVVERTSEAVYLTAVRRGAAGVAEHVGLRVAELPAGKGLAMVTYRGDPAAPHVWAEPIWIEVAHALEDQLAATWAALDPRFRVAVACRSLEADATWTVRAVDGAS